jgi:hypothetical protein
MARIASFLSLFALCSAVFAYSVLSWDFPSFSGEGAALSYGALAFYASAGALLVASLGGAILLARRKLSLWPLACSVATLCVLVLAARSN